MKNMVKLKLFTTALGLPGITRGKKKKSLPPSTGDVRDTGSILGSGRSPGEGNGSPFQCSCLENPMDRRAWWATFMGSHRVGRD